MAIGRFACDLACRPSQLRAMILNVLAAESAHAYTNSYFLWNSKAMLSRLNAPVHIVRPASQRRSRCRRQFVTVSAVAALLSACSMQYTPPGEVAAADMDDYQRVNAQGADVGLICKREPVVGTRLSKRTCSTAAQRKARREEAKMGLEEVQRKATAPSIQE